MEAKEIAKKIQELADEIGRQTGICGDNPLYFVKIAKELRKLRGHTGALIKLFEIVNTSLVLYRLNK